VDQLLIWLVALGVLSLVTVAWYFRLARRPIALPPVPGGMGFGSGDIVLAGLLGAYFLVNAANAPTGPIIINARVILMTCFVNLSLVILIVGFLVSRNRDPRILFGLRWTGWKGGLPLLLLSLAAILPLLFFTQLLMQSWLGPNARPQDILLYLQSMTSLPEKALVILMAVVVAPFAEETIFRGYFHGVLLQYAGRWPAIIINALLFAAIHVHLPSFAGLFFLAVGLTLVYEATGSLWASMLMHGLFNTITVAVTLLLHPA